MRSPHRALISAFLLTASVLATAQTPAARNDVPGQHSTSSRDLSPRVRALLAQMTQEEKLALTEGGRDPVYGGQAGYMVGVPRLGVPPMRLADGPVGILNRYPTTALPLTIAVAATFDPDLSRQYGEVLGKEARATNMDVVLGPMVNVARIPHWGRNATGYGEDPLVIGTMVAPAVKAIQAQGAMATVKHFLANNQSEHQGGGLSGAEGYDFVVDQRTLHEIYLPGFKAAIDAGSLSAMAAYNKVNGYWNAENADTLTGILRNEFDFKGFVMSDWHANRSTPSMQAGLDVEMPGLGPLNQVGREGPKWGPKLDAAIKAGTVSQSALDTAVGRILTAMDRLGMLNGTRVPAPAKLDIEGDAAIARAIAAQGAVLLKNDGALPLRPAALRSLLLIGPTAGQVAPGPGGGRSEGIPSRLISPLAALRSAAGADAKISYAVGDDLTGVAIPATALSPAAGTGSGLTRTPRDGGSPSIDAGIDFVGAKALPVGRGFTWTGQLRVPTSGTYTLMTQSWGGATELKIDGQVRAGAARLAFGNGVPRRLASLLPTSDTNLDNGQVTLALEAGKTYAIELSGQAEPETAMEVRLAWVTPEMRARNVAEAIAAARTVDTPVIFAWARTGEGFDLERNLSLPNDQDALIAAVAEANPNTIVVLNTANPVSMPWRDKVKAIVEMWYAGQEGGWATSDVLLGNVNPGGKLPITFPARAIDTPAMAPGHPERFTGVDNQVTYSEGIFVGYRHYDQNRIEPLYPFGYGLSYTTFEYSGLKIANRGGAPEATFRLRNTGKVAGTEVAQVYIGAPASQPVPMAVQSLAGFQRVRLEPGQSRTVTIRLARQPMSYWSEKARGWVIPGGARTVLVGSSSRDIRLRGEVRPR